MKRTTPAFLLAALAVASLAAGACDDTGGAAPSGDATGADAGIDVLLDPSTGDGSDGAVPLERCEGPTEQRYDPLVGAELELFPDDYLAREAETPTGVQLDVTVETAPWLLETPPLLRGSLRELSRLTGFGTNAPVLLRFSAPLGALPGTAEESVESDAVRFLDLGADPPERVPYEVTTGDDGRDLYLWPLRPLRPATRHAVVVTTALEAADGACVRPSDTTWALLTGDVEDARLAALAPRYADVLAATGLSAEQVSAAAVFTTDDVFPVLSDVAADVRSRSYAWHDAPTCATRTRYRRCVGSFDAFDYRDDRLIEDAEPAASWTIPVTVWLPLEGDGPFPTVVSGHGINATREMGAAIADRLSPLGFAVVGIDAMRHGEHPSADPGDDLAALSFLGIDLQAGRIDGLELRANFNQTLVDRLQLIELVRDAPDVDGDEQPDLDIDRLSYFGISLGAMMGPSLLALSDDVQAGVLSVGGGRLATFVTDNPQVQPMLPLIIQMAGSEAAFDRLVAVLQTLIDGADPATFAPYVLDHRLSGTERAPHLLFYVALDDEVVPPATGRALARALDIPHVGVIAQPVELLPRGGDLPLSGNLDEGTVTAGFFQYDRVSTDVGVRPATHNGTPFSPEAELQAVHFLETWNEDGVPEILDPFVELETPPLE